MLSSVVLGIPSPVFDGGWENHEPFVSTLQPQNPVYSISNSGSDEPDRAVHVVDQRKERRMLSNRESARRSRMRKQKHLEDLRNHVNRLRIKNREITNRLGSVTHNCHLLQKDNDRMLSETSILRQRLSNIRQFLLFRQLQHLSSSLPLNSINEHSLSLIA